MANDARTGESPPQGACFLRTITRLVEAAVRGSEDCHVKAARRAATTRVAIDSTLTTAVTLRPSSRGHTS